MKETDSSGSPEINERDYHELIGVLLDRHITPVVDDCLREYYEKAETGNRADAEFADPETVERVLMDEVQSFLAVIHEHYPTVSQLEDLLASGDKNCVFLKDDMLNRLSQAVGREQAMLKAGYDTMMDGFINYRSMVGKQVLERITANLLKKSAETGSPLALILLDLDDFKGVNDYGQLVGDEVLRHMAAQIREELRNSVCVRWGGEEIVVILDEIEVADAVKVAIRVNRRLNQNPGILLADVTDPRQQIVENATPISRERFARLRELTGEIIRRRAVERIIADPRKRSKSGYLKLLEVPLSASVGVVKMDPGAENPITEAVQRANQQERLAKENGKNQVWAEDNPQYGDEN